MSILEWMTKWIAWIPCFNIGYSFTFLSISYNASIDLNFEAKELGCLDAQYLLACIYLYEFKSKKKNEAGFKLIFDGKKKGHQKSIKKYSQLME